LYNNKTCVSFPAQKGEKMNLEKLKEGLIQLYNSTYKQRLNKGSYKNEVKNLKEKNRELLQDITEAISDDTTDNLEKIARIIPEYVADNLSQYSSKRKRETHQVDNNMNMVCFYIPIVNSIDSNLAERTVEIWNETMDKSKIGLSTIEGIDGGFKKGLCYITTAVCQTLNKGDDCIELRALRNYRDQYLLSTPQGEKIVRSYYNIAPTIVNRINKDVQSAKIYENILTTYIQPCLTLIEMGKNKECSRLYSEMVVSLEKKYM
jgi:hypothetical protein